MKPMKRTCVLSSVVVTTMVAAYGCGSEAEPASEGTPGSIPEVYSVTLSVATKGDLPACTTARQGTTAHVASPSGLWACTPSGWVQLPCTKLLGGSVAYESHSNKLWACVSGSWTGVTLPAGPPGERGLQGETGATGAPGPAGATSLIVQTAEPTGENCEHGGTKIESGVDLDASGGLDSGEISATSYVCTGAPGEDGEEGPAGTPGPLITVTPEPAGANCANGGQRIDIGLDTDGDNALSLGESRQTSYVCNGVGVGEACGDGHLDSVLGEVCDQGIATEACDSDCTLPACGDGLVNPSTGESCDPPGTLACDPYWHARVPSCEPSVLILLDRTGSMDFALPSVADALSYAFTGRGGVHWSLKVFPDDQSDQCTLSEGVSVASTIDPSALEAYLDSVQAWGNTAATGSAIEQATSYLLQGPTGPKSILLISDSAPGCGVPTSNSSAEAIAAAAAAAQVGITTHVVDAAGTQPALVALAEASGGEYFPGLEASLGDELNQLFDAATACAP